MTLCPVLSLAELKERPERVADLPARAAAILLGDVEGELVRLERLRDQLLIRSVMGGGSKAMGNGDGQDLVNIDEAARRLGRSRHWLYTHHASLPFTVQESRGFKLRFSAAGIERYLHEQQGRRAHRCGPD